MKSAVLVVIAIALAILFMYVFPRPSEQFIAEPQDFSAPAPVTVPVYDLSLASQTLTGIDKDSAINHGDKRQEDQWQQQQFRKFESRVQTHLNAYPLSSSADIWLVKDALAHNNLAGAKLYLDDLFSRAQPIHLHFIGSYIKLLVGVIDWLKNIDEQQVSMMMFSAIADNELSRIKQLRHKFLFIPGTGLLHSDEAVFNEGRDLLLQQLENTLNLALNSRENLIKLLYEYTVASELRCAYIRAVPANTSENDSQDYYPDISQYERFRYFVKSSPASQDTEYLKQWFDDFYNHWTKPNIPFCLHGGRLYKIGNAWLCKSHKTSYTEGSISSASLRLVEILTQYMVCHPEVDAETLTSWSEWK